jgi:hypothetical protein
VEGGGGEVKVDITAACAALWQPLQGILVAVYRVNQLKQNADFSSDKAEYCGHVWACMVIGIDKTNEYYTTE